MKEIYTAPEVEIVEFDAEDVITTSFFNGDYGNDFPNGGSGDIHIP